MEHDILPQTSCILATRYEAVEVGRKTVDNIVFFFGKIKLNEILTTASEFNKRESNLYKYSHLVR